MIRISAIFGALAVMLLAGSVQEAEAAPFSVTGQYRSGCCNFPNAMIGTILVNDLPFAQLGGGVTIRTGMSIPTGFIEQTLPGGTMMFPSGVISMNKGFTNSTPVQPPSFTYLKTVFAFNNAAGTLSPGGGPGNVAYCMNNTMGSNANPNCTSPGQAVAPFGGNLISHAVPSGAPNFGGTMTLLDGLPVNDFRRTSGTPLVIQSVMASAFVDVVGNPFSPPRNAINTAIIMSPSGTITAPLQVLEAGIPWGTGTVYGVATAQTGPFPTVSFSYQGSDNRNASGTGNVTLVSAHMASFVTGTEFISGIRMTLDVPEPGPTMALVAGFGLLVIAEGVRRRR